MFALDRGEVPASLEFLLADVPLRFGHTPPVIARPTVKDSRDSCFDNRDEIDGYHITCRPRAVGRPLGPEPRRQGQCD